MKARPTKPQPERPERSAKSDTVGASNTSSSVHSVNAAGGYHLARAEYNPGTDRIVQLKIAIEITETGARYP
jgi:hypothetical protein